MYFQIFSNSNIPNISILLPKKNEEGTSSEPKTKKEKTSDEKQFIY
jgi:hypothetical protein